MEFYNLHKSLKEVGESLSNKLKSLVPVRTGKLRNSINYIVDENELTIEAEEYFDYLDKGVNGTEVSYGSLYSYTTKMPPLEAFSAPTMRGNYAIATSIYKKGIKPRNFTKGLNIKEDVIVEGFGKDIEENINKELNGKN